MSSVVSVSALPIPLSFLNTLVGRSLSWLSLSSSVSFMWLKSLIGSVLSEDASSTSASGCDPFVIRALFTNVSDFVNFDCWLELLLFVFVLVFVVVLFSDSEYV